MTGSHQPSEAPVFPGAPVVLGVPGAPGQPGAYTWNRFVWRFGPLDVVVEQEKEDGTWRWTVGDDGSSGEPSLPCAIIAVDGALQDILAALIATPAYAATASPKPTQPEATLPRGPEVAVETCPDCGRERAKSEEHWLGVFPRDHLCAAKVPGLVHVGYPEAWAECADLTITRLRAEVARLEAERHDIWAAGYAAASFDADNEPSFTPNPYPARAR